MKMKKTGRKEGEKKQNGNTLRTRAGNRVKKQRASKLTEGIF
jgi:hypothetical protein